MAEGTYGLSVQSGEPKKGSRKIHSPQAGAFVDAAVYDRYRLGPGFSFQGPAVVEEREHSTVGG